LDLWGRWRGWRLDLGDRWRGWSQHLRGRWRGWRLDLWLCHWRSFHGCFDWGRWSLHRGSLLRLLGLLQPQLGPDGLQRRSTFGGRRGRLRSKSRLGFRASLEECGSRYLVRNLGRWKRLFWRLEPQDRLGRTEIGQGRAANFAGWTRTREQPTPITGNLSQGMGRFSSLGSAQSLLHPHE